MNEKERERIKLLFDSVDIVNEIELALNMKLREILHRYDIDETDLNALSQAQNTFLKYMTGE